ncbi:MAG: NAD(P)H-dependent oxidoreductase [Erysipelothrix sp.]|nr:NAD(P)H-dependent oxidoreductase [Erysipelothrix sp.]
MKIGIISSSMRDDSGTDQIARWIENLATNRGDGVHYELVSLDQYDLPLFGTKATEKQESDIKKWKDTIASFDGYIMITPEYNRNIPGFFKNSLDYLMAELHDKAVSYVSFGGLGGLAAIQSLRLINAEQAMASVRAMVTLSINLDFDDSKVFSPQPYQYNDAELMFTQLVRWTKAMKTIR